MFKNILVVFITIALSPFSYAGDKSFEAYSEFLTQLGYEDYSAAIAQNLAAGEKGLGEASPKILKFNQKRFTIVNDTRDLAALFFSELETRKQFNRSEKAKLAQLVGHTLNLQPLDPPTEIPVRILNLPEGQRKKAAKEYFTQLTQHNIEHQVAQTLSNFMQVLYPDQSIKELETAIASGKLSPAQKRMTDVMTKMQNYLTRIYAFAYFDGQMGQTRYLGKAMALSASRYAKIHDDNKLPEQLKRAAKLEGLHLENYVGTTWVMPQKGHKEPLKLQIENGDVINERALGPRSGTLSWAARPAFSNTLLALKQGLWSHPLTSVIPIDDKPAEQMSLTDYLRVRFAESRIGHPAYSHVGMANVLTDPKTGISTTWIIDNYPNDEEGGIRLTDMHQFGPSGPIKAIGVTRYDPKKFAKFVQETVATTGYNPVAWDGEKEQFDKDGDTDHEAPIIPQEVPTRISAEEFKELHNIKPGKEKQWFAAVMKRVTDFIRRDMVTKEGIGFGYGFSNYCGRGYCSQTLVLASKMAAGIDLQKQHDRYSTMVHIIKAIGKVVGFELGKDVRTELRIVAPLGFATQRDLLQEYHHIEYPRTPYTERMRVTTGPISFPMNPALAEVIGRISRSNEVADNIEYDHDMLADMIERRIDQAREQSDKSREWGSRRVIGSNSHLHMGAATTCVQLIRTLE